MTDREIMQQALEFVEFVWRDVSLNDYAEEKRHHIEKILEDALAQPEPEPFFTAANGFPQTFVSKDRQKNAIISLTEQCADLIRERDELQKQVWLYEKNGVTCQTYRHTVEQSCAECNVQMSYTTPPQRKPLTEVEIYKMFGWYAMSFVRAVERAHGIGGKE